MLGFALHRMLHDAGWKTFGCIRSASRPSSTWCGGLEYVTGADAGNLGSVIRALDQVAPDVVINAIGVNSVAVVGGDVQRMLTVNSMLPRRLDFLAGERNFRLVHFSSDGVFSGRVGNYDEHAVPDADDPYGVSKFLGEPGGPQSLVLRTSLIGRSLQSGQGLLDWLLRQHGTVTGFTRVIFSGLTVDEIGAVIDRMLRQGALPSGVHHLSGNAISKFDLIRKLSAAWGMHDLDVQPSDSPVCDRSLDSRRLRHLIGYVPPDWDKMITTMKEFYAGLDQLSLQL